VSKGDIADGSNQRESPSNPPPEDGEGVAEEGARQVQAADEGRDVEKEIKRGMTKEVRMARKGARAVFRAVGVDNSGTLDDRELMAALKKMGFKNINMDGVAKLRARVDTNGDGVVQFEEFVQALELGALTQQQDKFIHSPSWASFEAQANMQHAATLEHTLGCMDTGNTLKGMYAEHCNGADADTDFSTSWGVMTTPATEWDYVVGLDGIDPATWRLVPSTLRPEGNDAKFESADRKFESADREGEGKCKGRNRRTIEEIMQEPLAVQANLCVEEVIALRMLTGPMHLIYNQVLRASRDKGSTSRASQARGGNLYTNTIFTAISGIVKISQHCMPPSPPLLFRGFGVSKDPSFYEQFRDDQKHVWGSESGFLSASSSKVVACPPVPEGGTPSLVAFPIDGPMAMGADLSFCTQFDHELEWVYAPGAHMAMVGVPDGHGESIYTLRVTRSCMSKTIEQTRKASAEAVERVALHSVSRLKNAITNSFGGAWGKHIPQSAMQEVRSREAEWYLHEYRCSLSMEEVVRASQKSRRQVVEEVLERGMVAEEAGDVQEASMQYRAGFEIVDALWSEEEDGRLEALLGMLEKKMGAMEKGGLPLPVAEQVRMAELLGQNGEHKAAMEVWDSVMKDIREGDEYATDGEFFAKALYGAADAMRVTGRYSESLRVFEECCGIYSTGGLSGAARPQTTKGTDQSRAQTAKSSRPQTTATRPSTTATETSFAFQRLETPMARLPVHETERGKFAIGHGAAVRGTGLVLDALGKDDEALEKFREAANITSRVIGPRHFEVATSIVCQAATEKKLGMHSKALDSFKRALTMRRKAYGFKHPLVAECLHGIGGVLKMLGKFGEAVDALTQEIQILRLSYGHVHLDVARVLSDIAVILEMEGKREEALDHYEECRRVRRRLLGDDSLDLAATLFSIAKLREGLGDFEEAFKDAKDSLRICRAVAGDFDNKTVLRAKMVERIQATMRDETPM